MLSFEKLSPKLHEAILEHIIVYYSIFEYIIVYYRILQYIMVYSSMLYEGSSLLAAPKPSRNPKLLLGGGSWDLVTTNNWDYNPTDNWGNPYKPIEGDHM